MKQILLLIILILLLQEGRSQNIAVNAILNTNYAFPTINDEVFSPQPVPANGGFTSYTVAPDDIYRTGV